MKEATKSQEKTVKKPKSKKAEASRDPKSKVSKSKASDSKSFAVIATGGKQYRVSAGKKIKIEKLSGSYKEGDAVMFDSVLLHDDGEKTVIGTPYVEGSKVKGKITKISRAPKVTVIKYKQKSRYFKKGGHRQPYFEVEIETV